MQEEQRGRAQGWGLHTQMSTSQQDIPREQEKVDFRLAPQVPTEAYPQRDTGHTSQRVTDQFQPHRCVAQGGTRVPAWE